MPLNLIGYIFPEIKLVRYGKIWITSTGLMMKMDEWGILNEDREIPEWLSSSEWESI